MVLSQVMGWFHLMFGWKDGAVLFLCLVGRIGWMG